MMFRTSLILLLAAFMATATSISSTDRGQSTYIVHMDKAKITALGQTLGGSKKWYESVMDSITDELSTDHQHGEDEEEEEEEEEEETTSPPPQLLYAYETVMTGFSAKLTIKQLQALNNIEGFLSAVPDELLTLHTTHSPQFLGLHRGKGLWSSRNLAASDVIIGVIDSGIWPEHVSFLDDDNGLLSPAPKKWKGECEEGTRFTSSNCNKKLIGARALFKGYEARAGRINETTDYRSARDSLGHGTHTASTAAGGIVAGASVFGMAKGAAAGAMYSARIAAYKVCYARGCANSDILAGIDIAVSDGVDILSLSLGGASRDYYTDSLAVAAFGAVQNGVFVSCSAGNSGPSGSTVTNSAPWIMTVAASSLDRSFPTVVKLGNGETFRGASLYSGKPVKRRSLAYGRTAGTLGAEFCVRGALSPDMVKGKVVVCQRGINGRVEKGEHVRMASGAGMLLLNTDDQGEELIADPHILPATSLGASAGNSVVKYVTTAGNPTASIEFLGTLFGDPAPAMAAFSSRGPASEGPYVIKPDVTAPGVNILAAWPPTVSPTRLDTDTRSVIFNIVSGTSMSCPHVSGIAALLKAAHKDWSPAAIKSALMTTAYTLNTEKAPISDVGSGGSPATPFSFGSGHVDPERASNPGLIYDIKPDDYLNFLCSINYTSSQVALVARGVNFTCPTDSFLVQPGDLNYPSFAVLFNGRNNSVTYKRTVTNVGQATSTYRVRVEELPDGVSVMVDPTVLKFRKLNQRLTYKVSFVGTRGGSSSSPASSFGSLVWVSKKFRVRSPIAVTWQ